MTHSYAKDKIHYTKEIDDESSIKEPGFTQISQCPKCLSIFNIEFEHKCKLGWKWCSICGLDLHKKGKEKLVNGVKYVTMPSKKHYNILDKLVCWECAFKIVKEFKHDKEKS